MGRQREIGFLGSNLLLLRLKLFNKRMFMCMFVLESETFSIMVSRLLFCASVRNLINMRLKNKPCSTFLSLSFCLVFCVSRFHRLTGVRLV